MYESFSAGAVKADRMSAGDESVNATLSQRAPLNLKIASFPNENFRRGELLGTGGDSAVYAFCASPESKARPRIAVKVATTEEGMQEIAREKKILRTFQHASIPKLYELHEDSTSETARVLAMSIIPGETLASRIEGRRALLRNGERAPVSKTELCSIIGAFEVWSDVLAGLHQSGLIMSDYKLFHLMSDNSSPEGESFGVLDFGNCSEIGRNIPRSLYTFYCAPEQVICNLTVQADVYGTALLLLEALTGKFPIFHLHENRFAHPLQAHVSERVCKMMRDVTEQLLIEDEGTLAVEVSSALGGKNLGNLAQILLAGCSVDKGERPATPQKLIALVKEALQEANLLEEE